MISYWVPSIINKYTSNKYAINFQAAPQVMQASMILKAAVNAIADINFRELMPVGWQKRLKYKTRLGSNKGLFKNADNSCNKMHL